MNRPATRSHSSRAAFTLIELLTVIAIIAVLAAITMGLTAAAKNARINSRAQTDLRQVQTAIEAYKSDRNAYPPDHLTPQGTVDPVLNPLYYELIGMDVSGNGFRPRGSGSGTPVLTSAQVQQLFGRRGFLNASVDPAEPARTFLEPKSSAVWNGTVEGIANVSLLVTPFPWPPSLTPLVPGATPNSGSARHPNPWRYVSTSPTNNPGGFDLWVEIHAGKEMRVFKNW